MKEAVKQVADAGAKHVLASFGAEGMIYTDGLLLRYKADGNELSEIKSTVGAGDAALAGFIIAHDYKYDVKKSQFAAAFGTASRLVGIPRRISVAMVNNQVAVLQHLMLVKKSGRGPDFFRRDMRYERTARRR